MTDLRIKMGVQAPGKDVNDVLKMLDYISQNYSNAENPLRMQAYARDLSDGAVGVLASMSVIFDFDSTYGQQKTVEEHILNSFARLVVEGQPIYEIVVTPLAQELISLVYEQREYEGKPKERAVFLRKKAEELGLC